MIDCSSSPVNPTLDRCEPFWKNAFENSVRFVESMEWRGFLRRPAHAIDEPGLTLAQEFEAESTMGSAD